MSQFFHWKIFYLDFEILQNIIPMLKKKTRARIRSSYWTESAKDRTKKLLEKINVSAVIAVQLEHKSKIDDSQINGRKKEPKEFIKKCAVIFIAGYKFHENKFLKKKRVTNNAGN